MTPIRAYDYLSRALRCLDAWDAVLAELREQATEFIDVDPIARQVCMLDAVTRSNLRRLEELMLR